MFRSMPILWLLLAASAVPSTILAYDAQTRYMSAGYDVCSPSATDYDSGTVFLGNERDRIEYSLYATMTYRIGTNDAPFLFNGRFGVQTDPNGLLDMRARYYNPYLCRFINPDPSGFSGGLNWYAYANGNPVSYLDPFGLGALESDIGGSWVNQIASGLGVDNSLAAQQGRQDALVGAVNFATMGLANDASSAFTGYDLAGNRATRQDQLASAAMLGVAFIPGGEGEATVTRAALGAIERGEVTTYADFVSRSVVGDNLAGHEVWQHSNLQALGLATERLSTDISRGNPVIALDSATHAQVSAAQRAIDAATQAPRQNISANIQILRNLGVAPPDVLDALEQMAINHARTAGH
jgi:RHS repeat-associated protein